MSIILPGNVELDTYDSQYTPEQIEAAIGKGPIVQNGTWWVWSVADSAYQDTGVSAVPGPGSIATEMLADGAVTWPKLAPETRKVNDNMLDNAYFIGGGSQQGGGQFPINQRNGHFVPAGKAYRATDDINAEVAGTTDKAYPATYYNSTFYTITISGTTYYVYTPNVLPGYITTGASIYSIDRWKFYNGDGLAPMTLTAEGIQFKASAVYTSGLIQIVEESHLTPLREYTLSALLKVTKNDTIVNHPTNENIALSYGNTRDTVYGSKYLNKANAALNIWTVHSFTFVLPESSSGLYNFRIRSLAGNVEYCVAAMKLELGPHQTLAHESAGGGGN